MDGDIRQTLGRMQAPYDAILQGRSEEEIIHLVDKKLLSKLRDYGSEPINLILKFLETYCDPNNKDYSLRSIFESSLNQNPIQNNRARDCAKEVVARFSVLSRLKSKEENQFFLVRDYINNVLEKNFYEICLTKSSNAEKEIITTAFSKIRSQVSKNIDFHAKKIVEKRDVRKVRTIPRKKEKHNDYLVKDCADL